MKYFLKPSKSVVAIAFLSALAAGCAEEEVETTGGAGLGAEEEVAEFPSAGNAILNGSPEVVGETEGVPEGPTTGAGGGLEEGVAENENVLEGAVESSGAADGADVIEQDAGL
jgi:hypothetical protein